MRFDPFSYFVVSDGDGKASGWVYHDERDGWGFETKRFAWMKVEMENRVIRSVRVEGSFEDVNEVERIVVRTELNPKGRRRRKKERLHVVIQVKENGTVRNVEFVRDEEKKLITIRKPLVKVTGEWEIEMN